MVWFLPEISLRNISLLFRPKEFIKSAEDKASIVGRYNRTKEVVSLAIFFVLNVYLFTLPLSSLGIDIFRTGIYAIFLSGFVFWIFYGTLLVSGTNPSLLNTFHTIVYGTSMYLLLFIGIGFTLDIWVDSSGMLYLLFNQPAGNSVSPPLLPATLSILTETLTGGEPIENIYQDIVAPIVGLSSLMIYLYTLYISARVRHDASRLVAGITVAFSLGAFSVTKYVVFVDRQEELWTFGGPISVFELVFSGILVLVLIFIWGACLRRYE